MKKIKIASIFIILLSLLVIFISPIFKIKKIEVTGNKLVSKEEVSDIFKVLEGKNILFLSNRDIEELIGDNKYIKSYRLDKKYPSSISIRLEEERYIAYYSLSQNIYFINSSLDVIKNDDRLLKGEIPEIVGLNSDIENISDLKADKNLSELIGGLDKREVINKVKFIDVYNSEDIRLVSKEDVLIYLGNSENLEKKVNNLSKIIKEINLNDIQSIDFKGNNPIIKNKK